MSPSSALSTRRSSSRSSIATHPGLSASLKSTRRVHNPVSYLDYLDWKRLNKVFRSLDAFALDGGFTLSAAAGPQLVSGTRVSAGFFRTLGVAPILGRDFRAGEDSPSTPETVLVTYSAWQKRFGGKPDALGHAATLNGTPHIVIGVLPRDFHFAPAGAAEFWTTLRDSGGTFGESNPCEKRLGCHNLNTVARLSSGVSAQTALAGMKPLEQQLQKQYPESNRDQGANVLSLSDAIVGDVRTVLRVLLPQRVYCC